jgi:hypothetical protein
MGLLTCTKCKQEKEDTLEFFPPHNKKKNGLDSWCRQCRNLYRSIINRGVFRKVISDENLISLKDTTKECVICGSEEKLVVDHCHTTGKVRGMLCQHCNLGLGHFRDDPDLLEFARIYLLSSNNEEEAEEYLTNQGE